MSLQVHAIQISPVTGMSTVNPNLCDKLVCEKKKSPEVNLLAPYNLLLLRIRACTTKITKQILAFPPDCCNNPVCCYMADPQPLELYPRVPFFQDAIYINYMSPAGLLFWHIRMQNVLGSRWHPVLSYCMPKLLNRTGWAFLFSFLFLVLFF